MKTTERIEIALASDAGYYCGLLVTAYSMAAHTSAALRFTILDGGLSDLQWNEFQTVILRANGRCAFNRVKISADNFKDCLLWHGNHMTYARLLLPRLLSDVDYCIYCDVDFLWMEDVQRLWGERRPDIALISTKDGCASTLETERKWLSEHGFAFNPDTYFCAGLTFFNLKLFRDDDLDRKCFELLKLKPPYNDQTVLYVATYGKTLLVDKMKWQVFSYELRQEHIDHGCVIHYAGEIPWKMYRLWFVLFSDAILLWHKVNGRAVGIGTWRSVLRYHTLGSYVYHRGVCLALRVSGIRMLVRVLLTVLGKQGTWNLLESHSLRIR